MTETTINRTQAYQVAEEFLAEFLGLKSDANLGDVLSNLSPFIWAEGTGDPAVPSDWSKAVAAVTARSAPSPGGDREPSLEEQTWLAALFPFLDSMWPILGNYPVGRLLDLLAQPNLALAGSDSSPWQLWLEATEAVFARASEQE